MTKKWFLYYFPTNFILFYANCFIQALRRRHHTVGSNQSNAIEEAKKINQMNRDKRHQTIDNSQSVSNTLLQVWSTAIQSVQNLVCYFSRIVFYVYCGETRFYAVRVNSKGVKYL